MDTNADVKTELLQTLNALDAEDLRLILESWKETQELQKRPGYENAYVILRK